MMKRLIKYEKNVKNKNKNDFIMFSYNMNNTKIYI